MGFEPMTSAIAINVMLYQLSYEASLEAGQVWVIYIDQVVRTENEDPEDQRPRKRRPKTKTSNPN